MKTLNFFVFTLVIFLFSCSTNDLELTPHDLGSERLLSDEQINLIGELHNQELDKIFEDFNWEAEDKFQELETKYLRSRKEELIEIPRSLDESITVLQQELKDEEDYAFFMKTLNNITTNKNLETLSDIQNFLDEQERQAKNVISNDLNYEAFLVMSRVLKKSAEYWLPEQLEGKGNYGKLKELELRASNSNQRVSDWRDCARDVLAADGISGGIGFIVGAGVHAASTGPVAPLVFIGAIAAEAGASSGWEYLTSDNC